MRIIGTLLIILTFGFVGQAQDSAENIKDFHFGIVYPLSTNGLDANKYQNRFSAHLFGNVSAGELGLCLSGFGHVTSGDLNGMQISGFGNIISGKSSGIVMGGFGNVIHDLNGIQIAGFGNVSQSVEGIQSAGFINIGQRVNGIQGAGFMNVAQDVIGIQGAGFMNVAQNMNGIQAAGFMSIRKKAKGAQVSGFMNIGEDTEGAQIAGFMNIAKKVKGVQIAGFMNIADSSDYPIGIINIIRNGEMHLSAHVDELGSYTTLFRSGSRFTYGMIGLGINNQQSFTDRANAIMSEVGIGFYLPVSESFRFRIETKMTNLTNTSVEANENFTMSSMRFYADYNWKRIHLFAGSGFSYVRTNRSDFENPFIITSTFSNNTNHHLLIAAQAGISIRIK